MRIFIFLNLLLFCFNLSYGQIDRDYSIKLQSGEFTPEANSKTFKKRGNTFESYKFDSKYYLVLQFNRMPNTAEREKLASQGINLLSYLPNYAFIAEIPTNSLNLLNESLVRAVFGLKAQQKVDNLFKNDELPDYAVPSDGMAEINLLYYPGVNSDLVKSYATEYGAKISYQYDKYQRFTMTIPQNNVYKLAKSPWVMWIEPVLPPAEFQNLNGKASSGSYLIESLDYTGKNVKVGIWDGDVEEHKDLEGRVHPQETEMANDHGMHVAGTVGGSGFINPEAKGMAIDAHLYTWNFGLQSNNKTVPEEMDIAAGLGVSITQHSYGIPRYPGITFQYSTDDQAYDGFSNDNPNITTVFSAGNDGEFAGGPYYTTTKRMKNALIVGNIDAYNVIHPSSSCGPTNDGRIVPQVCAVGTNVLSTVYNNKYDEMTGTSMAAPVVSGVIAQLQEKYKTLNSNKNMPSALVKSILATTANDLGNPGPDYRYGFGAVNAVQAEKLLDNNALYATDYVYNDEIKYIYVNVPANSNTKKIIVTLAWNDPAANPMASQALVNDLDLVVANISESIEHQPLVLDSEEPSAKAKQGRDSLNNVEQVVISAGGTDVLDGQDFEIRVKGKKVSDSQTYAVSYRLVSQAFGVTYPIEGINLKTGSEQIIRWDNNGYEGQVNLSYSLDSSNGTFTSIGQAQASQRYYAWNVPEGVFSTDAIIKIEYGNEYVYSNQFNISGVPKNLHTDGELCGGEVTVYWDAVPGADGYDIHNLAKGIGYTFIKDVATNYATLSTDEALEEDITNWISVAAYKGSTIGAKSEAIPISLIKPIVKDGLPIEDNFDEKISNYFNPASADNANVTFVKGENNDVFLRLEGGIVDEDWVSNSNAQNAWNDNTSHYSSATTCMIDATHASGIRDLVMEFDLRQMSTFGPSYSWFRVRAKLVKDQYNNDVDEDFKALRDINGSENFNPKTKTDDEFEHLIYDLSDYVGCKFILQFQAACKYKSGYFSNAMQGDVADINNVKIYEPQTTDGGIVDIIRPLDSAPNMSANEEIEVKIFNFGRLPIRDFDLEITLSNPNTSTITYTETYTGDPIASLASVSYKISKDDFDFSETDYPYTLLVETNIADDNDDSNDGFAKEITNLGNNYYLENGFGNIVYVSSGTGLNFYDDGRTENYSANFEGAVTFLPDDNEHRIKATIQSFNLEGNGCNYDYMKIYNGSYINTSNFIDQICGQITTNDIYASTSYDGGLTFYFNSDNIDQYAGWHIIIESVPFEQYDAGVTAITSPVNGELTDKQEITVTVKNFGKEVLRDIPVGYRIDGVEIIETLAGPIAKGASLSYTFTQKADLGEPYKTYLIEAFTGYPDDQFNENDLYVAKVTNYESCSASGGDDEFISNVQIGDISNQSGDEDYSNFSDLSTDFLFGESYDITVTNGGGTYPEDICGVWIDWNKNGNFDEEVIQLQNDGTGKYFTGTIIVPADAETGEAKMRIRIQYGGTLYPCGTTQFGEVEDYTAVIGGTAVSEDVGIKSIELNKLVNLDETYTPRVKVVNYGQSMANFEITMAINDGYIVTKQITDLAPETELLVEFADWRPTEKARFMAMASIEIDDDRVSNNTKTKEIEVIEMTKAYAFSFEKIDVSPDGTNEIFVPEGYVQMYLQDPSRIKLLNTPTIDEISDILSANNIVPTCGTWADNKWYVISEFDQSVNKAVMYAIEPVSGSVEKVMDIPQPVSGLSYSAFYNEDFFTCPAANECDLYDDYTSPGYPSDMISPSMSSKAFFATVFNGSVSFLYRIDLSMHEIYPLGSELIQGRFLGLAANIIGELYAYHENNEIYYLDPVHSSASYIGEVKNFETSYQNLDMEFDNVTNELYLIGTNALSSSSRDAGTFGRKELHRVDIITGESTYIGTIGSESSTGFAIPYNENEATAQTDFLYFEVPGQTDDADIDKENNTINILVEPGTDLSDISFTFKAPPGSTIERKGNPMQSAIALDSNGNAYDRKGNPMQSAIALDATKGPILIEVTAADGVTKEEWTINVAPPSNETDVTTFIFEAANNDDLDEDIVGEINHEDLVINVSMPFNTDLSALVPSFALSTGAKAMVDDLLQKSGQSVVDFASGIVTYDIKASDGTIRQWTIIVNIQQSTNTDVLYFGFRAEDNPRLGVDIKADIMGDFINIVVPDDAFLSSLKAEYILSDGAVATTLDPMTGQIIILTSRVSILSFVNDFVITVTAQNGNTKTYWVIIKYESEIETGISDSNTENVLVYPNPTKGLLHFANISKANVEIYNMFGSKIIQRKVNDSSAIIDLSNYAAGMYLLRITYDGKTVIRKIDLKK